MSSWHFWEGSKCGVPRQGPSFPSSLSSAVGLPSHISRELHFQLKFITKETPGVGFRGVKGEMGVPTGLGQFPVGCLPTTLEGLLPGVPSVELCHGRCPGSSRHLSWQTGLSGSWGLRLAPGTQAVPGGQWSWGRAHSPRSCSGSNLPLPVCDPQPETEDEKKRFEEGKGRYLQMKAKRQGQAEPQP